MLQKTSCHFLLTNALFGCCLAIIRCVQKASVKWDVTDPCGHSIQTEATFSLVDEEPPTLTGGQNKTVTCDGTSMRKELQAWIDDHGGLNATDECSEAITWSHSPYPPKLSNTCPQTVAVTFTATDSCGNDAVSDELTFSVVDQTPPFVTKPPTDTEVECNPSLNTHQLTAWLRNYASMDADDSCYPSPRKCPVFEEVVAGGCLYCGNLYAPVCCEGTEYVNMCHAHCQGKNYGDYTIGPCTTTAAANVQETTPAVCASCQNDYDPVCVRGDTNFDNPCLAFCHKEFEFIHGVCSYTQQAPQSDCSYCDFGVGGVVCGADENSYPTPCHASCNDVFSYYEGACMQQEEITQCGPSTLGWDVIASNNAGQIGSECETIIEANVTATDDCGNSVTNGTAFTVSDKLAPAISPAASDHTVECNKLANVIGKRSYKQRNGGAVASDQCTNGVDWSNKQIISADTCPHEISYTFAAEDACGNTDTTTGKLIIEDTVAPYFIIPAQDLTLQCQPDGNYAEIEAYLTSKGSATADDECRWEESITTLIPPADLKWHIPAVPEIVPGCTQKHVFMFGISDSCMNVAQSEGVVTVEDNAAPTITRQPTNGKAPCGPNAQAELQAWLDSVGTAMADDECGNGVKWSYNFPGFADDSCGQQVELRFIASDKCGNSVTTEPAMFEIYDDLDPEITGVTDKSIECSKAGYDRKLEKWLSEHADGSCTDQCDSNPLIKDNNPSLTFMDAAALQNESLCQNMHLNATFTCMDDCGNAVNQTAAFYAIDTQPPQIYGYGTDLVHYCDERCTDTLFKENADAKVLFQKWTEQEYGCLTVEDCNEVSWSFAVAATDAKTYDVNNLCGTSGKVEFTATDACGKNSSRTLNFQFPTSPTLPPPAIPLVHLPPTQPAIVPPPTAPLTRPVVTFTLPTVSSTTITTTVTRTTKTTLPPPPAPVVTPSPPNPTVQVCTPAVVDVCTGLTMFDQARGMGSSSGSRPTSLMFEYVGGGIITNRQDGKASVSGASVSSTATISGGGTSKTGVTVGDQFSLSTNGGSSSSFTISGGGGTQYITIHTSCSKALSTGDIFGGLKIIGFNGQKQGESCVVRTITTTKTTVVTQPIVITTVCARTKAFVLCNVCLCLELGLCE